MNDLEWRATGRRLLLATLATGAFTLSALPDGTARAQDDAAGGATMIVRGAVASPAVAPHEFNGDLRALPVVREWQTGDPIMEGPVRRQTHPQNESRPFQPRAAQRDPLLDVQAGVLQKRAARSFTPADLNFDGQGFTGVAPPDPVGEVGPSHYIQMINGSSGARIIVLDKTSGTPVAGPMKLSALWAAGGPCTTGFGDGIVLFDHLASRWLMAEFAAEFLGNHLCIYVSKSSDPVSGGWFNYDFALPEFPDYPKYAVWPDAYYVSTNESAPAVYAFDRARMLAGLSATFQRSTASSLAGFGFQALTPSDLDGPTPPPAGSPNFFMRHRDDEVHNALPNPTQDFLEIWQFHADFTTPANSTFGLAAAIPVSEFDSNLCGLFSFSCFPQPASGTPLDPIREVIMWRLQYRNFGSHQTLVGNFVTDVDGTDHGGIRWFELRRVGVGPWSLFQEGTYAPDAANRWLGSIAMDGGGNMALGFSITGTSVFPGVRYTGRLAGDGAGTMPLAEATLVNGTGSQGTPGDPNPRWGDYSSMNVDPVDDCTFWYTNEYIPASGLWNTRVARFRFPNPTCVDTAAPVCGNNVREVGEDCDGTDAPFCSSLCLGTCKCPTPLCGNNVVELGEECDGTSASACAAGVCDSDCTCQLCGPAPAVGCHTAAAAKSSVLVRDPVPADDTKDQVKWSWRQGTATALDNFGDPINGAPRFEFCVYDGAAAPQPLMKARIPPGGTCGTGPCWKAIRNGFQYKNKAATPEGITLVKVKAGADGIAQARVTGKGINLTTPNPALTLPVTAQLLIRNGATTQCWQTQYTTSTRNTDEQFKAKGP